jgi:hypothetical protein
MSPASVAAGWISGWLARSALQTIASTVNTAKLV